MPPSTIPLLEEYRLIERSEHEVNGVWKGAHIVLFFLAFVFGSFCTFCFHMLMYMFDEKCVLFPKLQSLTSLRHNVIYEFIPQGKDAADMPVDFLSTQWVEKSACYLPTYVPLVSGIFGLVWTTMFLMCSTGSRTLTGLQRPWRILPPVFIFSVAMSVLSVYYAVITQCGLEELCLKLSEITGSPTCTYTVNVATLVYERRIRGVYQATRLTILSAWLHTSCWIMSALLALVRVVLVVDFQLVRINVDLVGDIDKMMENHEAHIRTVSPDRIIFETAENTSSSESATSLQTKPKTKKHVTTDTTNLMCTIFYKGMSNYKSEISLLPEERVKLTRIQILESMDKKHYFIAEMIFQLVDNLSLHEQGTGTDSPPSLVLEVVRQYGQSRITSLLDQQRFSPLTNKEAMSENELNSDIVELKQSYYPEESVENITDSMKERIRESLRIDRTQPKTQTEPNKSNMKHVSIQTDPESKPHLKSEPKIMEQEDSDTSSDKSQEAVNKESQTPKKEKQD